jgi:hypothetical protein
MRLMPITLTTPFSAPRMLPSTSGYCAAKQMTEAQVCEACQLQHGKALHITPAHTPSESCANVTAIQNTQLDCNTLHFQLQHCGICKILIPKHATTC